MSTGLPNLYPPDIELIESDRVGLYAAVVSGFRRQDRFHLSPVHMTYSHPLSTGERTYAHMDSFTSCLLMRVTRCVHTRLSGGFAISCRPESVRNYYIYIYIFCM